jgi:4-hydroxy-tetrahydrodipicolinate reductase
MKIALIGYGKMGQEIHKLCTEHEVVIIDPKYSEANYQEISANSLEGVDVAIDFSHPDCIMSNIHKVAEYGTNLVVGTTGWYDKMEEVKELANQKNIGLLWASNFSIGVHMFWRILEKASQEFATHPEYDVFGHEFHHNQKADSPSGTAKSTAEIVLKNSPKKSKISYETSHETIPANTLHFTSTRGGQIPGTHTIFFDSQADNIEIKHTARNREGFALGAIKCAQWLNKKTGFFTIDDYLNSN